MPKWTVTYFRFRKHSVYLTQLLKCVRAAYRFVVLANPKFKFEVSIKYIKRGAFGIHKGNKEVAIQTQLQPPCVFPCKWAQTGLLLFHLLMQLPGQQLEPGHAGGLLDYWSQFYQVNRKITVSKLSQFEKDMNRSVSKYWYYAKSPLFTDILCRVNQTHLC